MPPAQKDSGKMIVVALFSTGASATGVPVCLRRFVNPRRRLCRLARLPAADAAAERGDHEAFTISHGARSGLSHAIRVDAVGACQAR
jgi:hypothetical protein